jgi:hypothetical protein
VKSHFELITIHRPWWGLGLLQREDHTIFSKEVDDVVAASLELHELAKAAGLKNHSIHYLGTY